MIKISHRGNLYGKNKSRENSPDYVIEAINAGYDVEIDFWVIGNKMYLGHDEPTYEVDMYFINSYIKKLWLHCKNLEALDLVLSMPKYYNAFWHQEDNFTITTNHFIWTYPGMPVKSKSILVHTDMPSKEILGLDMAGICSDHIGRV